MVTIESLSELLDKCDVVFKRGNHCDSLRVHFNPHPGDNRYLIGLIINAKENTIRFDHASSPYTSSAYPLEVCDAYARCAAFIRASGLRAPNAGGYDCDEDV